MKSCEVLKIHTRTFKRWKVRKLKDLRKGALKIVPRRLSVKECQAIMDICSSKEYRDLNPYEIYIMLLERKTYKASVSKSYRVLRAHDLIHFRGTTRKGPTSHRPPERVAIGPNQVWAWDIP